MEDFILGTCMGIAIGTAVVMATLVVAGVAPKTMQEKFEKEAFKRGYMEKVINENDEVIYQWVEKK
jgi:hypothetical protein